MHNDERYYEPACPTCGRKLRYDATMGLWWCPDTECGTVVKQEVHRYRGTSRDFAPDEEVGEEWLPEQRNTVRRVIFVAGAIILIIAILAMVLSPLLWPRRPVLSVSPRNVEFEDPEGASSLPQAFAIENDGRGKLNWTVEGDRDWLYLHPLSGAVEEGVDVVTVTVDARGLAAGSHAATCTVTGEGAHNSPKVVSIVVTLSLPPEGRALLHTLGQGADVYYEEQPPYVEGPSGRPIALTNNHEAADVSWDELVSFVVEDDTDQSPYIEDLRMCGTFAEQLHNRAEAAGIRSAWVSVDFVDTDIGHALNAFVTTDRGLVFVDCTGANASVAIEDADPALCDYDKVAYVDIGSHYGLISLDYARSPSYSFYEEYSAAWEDYMADLEEYNMLVDKYNRLVESGNARDVRDARRLGAELQSRRVQLEMDQEVLGSCRWNQLGTVEHLKLYW